MLLETRIAILNALIRVNNFNAELFHEWMKLYKKFERVDSSRLLLGLSSKQGDLDQLSQCFLLFQKVSSLFLDATDEDQKLRPLEFWVFSHDIPLHFEASYNGRTLKESFRTALALLYDKLASPTDSLISCLFILPILVSCMVQIERSLSENERYWKHLLVSPYRRFSLALALMPGQILKGGRLYDLSFPLKSRYISEKLIKIHLKKQKLHSLFEDLISLAKLPNDSFYEVTIERLSRFIDFIKLHFGLFEEDLEHAIFLQETAKPPFYIRYMIPSLLVFGGICLAYTNLLVYSEIIIEAVKDFKLTVVSFWKNWIFKPLQEIYQTIRYQSSKLSVVSSESLAADMASLERMVINFATKNPDILRSSNNLGGGGPPLETLSQRILQGDIGVIMKKFEQDISSPIKSALFGNGDIHFLFTPL